MEEAPRKRRRSEDALEKQQQASTRLAERMKCPVRFFRVEISAEVLGISRNYDWGLGF